ncbi:hypothetical protein Plhal304r1_c009g0034631 [Plasmopara halstedii]
METIKATNNYNHKKYEIAKAGRKYIAMKKNQQLIEMQYSRAATRISSVEKKIKYDDDSRVALNVARR